MMPALCDRCVSPGACCKKMRLRFDETNKPVTQRDLDRKGWSNFKKIGRALWACTALQPDGRCGIYKRRPQVCRSYKAGSDDLCVMYRRGSKFGEAA